MLVVQDVSPQPPTFNCGSISPAHFLFLFLRQGLTMQAQVGLGPYYIDKAGLKLMEIHLPLPLPLSARS